MYDKLYEVIQLEKERQRNYSKWEAENLPKFENVLTQSSPCYIYREVVAWEFTVEVDKQVWQPVKGWKGFYEPNKRTKRGKAMRERISIARGQRFSRLKFFKIFETSMPVGRQFVIPNAFLYDDIIYMVFDDTCYIDLITEQAGQFEEILRTEWDEAVEGYSGICEKSET